MLLVQFRVHPGVGCARMGNSTKAYYLASEFPHFLQEAFPGLRFKPKPRVHPQFVASLDTYEIFETSGLFDNKFKEKEGSIFPQAARFRVFAYVYDDEIGDTLRPQKVFEIRSDVANITWKVNLANKKAQTTVPGPTPGSVTTKPFENARETTTDLETKNASFVCKSIRPDDDIRVNLAYIFLERDEADKRKVTGRLHVIGNEGEFRGLDQVSGLWSDDWHDSAGDGAVEANVELVDASSFRQMVGASSAADLKFLSYGTETPLDGSTQSIRAMPGWVVVGPPDYVPDMGHFVSLWDVALDRGFRNIEMGAVAAQPGKHMLIRSLNGDKVEQYKHTDYLIHIHPQLCLFDDVKFVSGEAFGDPEGRSAPDEGRAHNIHPDLPGGPPRAASASAAIKHGGILINARARKADFADPSKLKDPDSTKPIGAWLKRALFTRLRKPGSLYDKVRKFVVVLPNESGNGRARPGIYPRKLGRRLDFDRREDQTFGLDKDRFYDFPHYRRHDGHLLKFHGLRDAGALCGGKKSPPTAGPSSGPSLSARDLELLEWMDDMYWPATFSDMPLLRELSYTPHQYRQFNCWRSPGADIRGRKSVFDQIVSPALKTLFSGPGDADKHFLTLLLERPMFAPAMIDMAHLGAMLGGSFLPGIEVGREAGISFNWCLFHGATPFFPSIRFKPCTKEREHTNGTLTKDLAVPWSEDFKSCTESFWPTSRPGRTTKDGVTRQNWQIKHDKPIPHLEAAGVTGAALAAAADKARREARDDPDNAALEAAARSAEAAAAPFELVFLKEYWKALGFIRRDASDRFLEEEQTWH